MMAGRAEQPEGPSRPPVAIDPIVGSTHPTSFFATTTAAAVRGSWLFSGDRRATPGKPRSGTKAPLPEWKFPRSTSSLF